MEGALYKDKGKFSNFKDKIYWFFSLSKIDLTSILKVFFLTLRESVLTFWIFVGGDICPPCNAGSYQDKTGQTTCVLCPTGKYQSETGQTSCQSCPVGTSQDAEGLRLFTSLLPSCHQIMVLKEKKY